MGDKCIVRGCPNRVGEGGFVGRVCAPCHEMLESGVVGEGETFVHDLSRALDESVKLQSHYAGLINTYDGGARMVFLSIQAWLDRLSELKKKLR